jgi:delta 1-pyrroline-5-carboxylate dehydrogenase
MEKQIKNIIKQADAQWESWNELGSTARSQLLLEWSDEIAQHASFATMPAKMVRYQVNQGLPMIEEAKIMPGPTGESNELYASGRGTFIICSSTEASPSALVGMITTALLAGNCIVLVLPESLQLLSEELLSTLLASGIPKFVVQIATSDLMQLLISEPSSAGVVYAGDMLELLQINQTLANRNGLLAQLISETDLTLFSTITDCYYILRFITEKTCTVNITAIGGNAALLALGGGDH